MRELISAVKVFTQEDISEKSNGINNAQLARSRP